MLKTMLCSAALATAAFILPQSAHAALVGQTVSLCADSAYDGTEPSLNPADCDLGTSQPDPLAAEIFDPGVEFTLGDDRLFDFTDDQLIISYLEFEDSSSDDLYIFTGLTGITNVSLLDDSPLDVLFDFSSTAISVLIRDPECCETETVQAVFSVETGDVPPIPLPAGAPLVLSALGALALLRRSRRS